MNDTPVVLQVEIKHKNKDSHFIIKKMSSELSGKFWYESFIKELNEEFSKENLPKIEEVIFTIKDN